MNPPKELLPIDFSKPWWSIIMHQRWLALFLIISVLIRDIFWSLEPILVAVVLARKSWLFFFGACLVWAIAELNTFIMRRVNVRFQMQIIHSVFYNAHHYLLTIDPQYHIKRSSGAILAKIERAARGYEEVLEKVTFDFAPLIIGMATMVIILSHYSILLACFILVCLVIMICYGYYFARYACKEREREFIKTDDDFKAAALENLAQVHLIRASFSTDYMHKKLTDKVKTNCLEEQRFWVSYINVSNILNIIYTISVLFLIGFFVHGVQNGTVPLSHAIGIVLAYIQCTHQIKILQPFRMREITAIKDLFKFMPEFGKQTIPVFDGKAPLVPKDKGIELNANNVVFGYGQATLFNHHSLVINDSIEQPNKLYGIIGPSGVGKTTLLSILGGQLKPLQGTVFINGVDIYRINDQARRQLIALQGQVATSMKGSVRYNLLFGLPEDNGYSDDYLLETLSRTGLKSALERHQGLDTVLGEGALNLSGGQRQRLNFASLYLRATFYKPSLILIDEPTSSLDEISEVAIIQMIMELASSAVTVVIAHRLKTIEKAVGLIDLSLLSASPEIKVYTPEELIQQSTYYQRLLEGSESFDA